MPKKQSTSRLSTIAGRRLKITADDINELSHPAGTSALARDVRALAGSVASQDETPKKTRRVR